MGVIRVGKKVNKLMEAMREIERDVDMVGVRLMEALDFRVEGEAMGARVNISLRWLRLGPITA